MPPVIISWSETLQHFTIQTQVCLDVARRKGSRAYHMSLPCILHTKHSKKKNPKSIFHELQWDHKEATSNYIMQSGETWIHIFTKLSVHVNLIGYFMSITNVQYQVTSMEYAKVDSRLLRGYDLARDKCWKGCIMVFRRQIDTWEYIGNFESWKRVPDLY